VFTPCVHRTCACSSPRVNGPTRGESTHSSALTSPCFHTVCSQDLRVVKPDARVSPRIRAPWRVNWPLQDIRSLQSCLALVNRPSIAPSIYIAHTIAIVFHDESAIYDRHPTPLVYAIHHTILAMAISCKGQRVKGFNMRLTRVYF